MAWESILLWLAKTAGATIIGEKVKATIPFLNRSRKQQELARREALDAQRALGSAEVHIDLLVDDNAYLRELVVHLRGCVDALEHRCASEGRPVPPGFHAPPPRRKSAAETVFERRGARKSGTTA